MFITTLCLLAIAAWLFFNGWNEKRWVDAHDHDETVASDKGILPSFSAITGSASGMAAKVKDSAADAESPVGKAVHTIQEKSAAVGNKIDLKAAGERVSDLATRSKTMIQENEALGRVASKVSDTSRTVGDKIDLKAAGERVSDLASKSKTMIQENEALGKVASKVGDTSRTVGNRVGESVRKIRDNAQNSDGSSASDKDLRSRLASKLGNKSNDPES